ncbi:MAG: glutathione peroxidase [Alphaproteobacteria bacterium]|nr:glutathione peroxidase [Alphaproteobacteria bacterium]
MANLQDFSIQKIDGTALELNALKSQVVLWVNTASACGFTPQLRGLQQLHDTLSPQGLVVIGSPCNQFGGQDPAPNAEINAFCEKNYGVTFTLTEKIEVNGKNVHPLFQWLKKEAPGLLGSEMIKWNFTKFLIGRDGRVLRRFAPNDDPQRVRPFIEAALG